MESNLLLTYAGLFIFGIGAGMLHGFGTVNDGIGTAALLTGVILYVNGKTR